MVLPYLEFTRKYYQALGLIAGVSSQQGILTCDLDIEVFLSFNWGQSVLLCVDLILVYNPPFNVVMWKEYHCISNILVMSIIIYIDLIQIATKL